VYQFHVAPDPSVPPCTDNVVDCPEQIVVLVAEIDEAADDAPEPASSNIWNDW